MGKEAPTRQVDDATPRMDRRGLLWKLAVVLQLLGAALVGLPVLGYLLGPFVRKAGQAWVRLGPLEQFPEGKTRLAAYRNPIRRAWDGEAADVPCWVRRVEGGDFQVFSIHCTHLGCPVRWFEESALFMCPCHGGAFYADGTRAAGPPPRRLYEYQCKVKDGALWVLGGRLPTLQQDV
jgi:nitrite reductase/ring-hydroxylating ferredoxin subunit